MDITLIISAFVAGMLTFLAPCTLPLVPAYLGFISGVHDPHDLQDQQKIIKLRRRIMTNALFFVLGFSVVFACLGLLASTFGHLFGGTYRDSLARIGGLIIIVFGLMLIGTVRIPFLQRTFKWQLPAKLQAGKPLPSFLIGVALAFGWSPCIGPILGTILTLAANSNTVLSGVGLLIIYSIGLALPFLLVAFSIGSAFKIIRMLTKYAHVVNLIAGIFLVVIGILMITNNFGIFAQGLERFVGPEYFNNLVNYL